MSFIFLMQRQSIRISLVLLAAAGVLVTGAAPGNAAQAAHVPRLSHQLCYTSSANRFKIPKKIELTDIFSPKGFLPKVGAAISNCNPVREIRPSGRAFPVTDAAGHLACFSLSASRQRNPKIKIANEFGRATLRVGQPKQVCLPTWLSKSGPPKVKTAQPPGLDIFTCYSISGTSGKFTVPSLRLRDDFASHPVRARVGAKPILLCAPSMQFFSHRRPRLIVHPGSFLTCYGAAHTPVYHLVWDHNEFGEAVVAPHLTHLLCVPGKSVR
jgi:hypothetical protein